MNMKLNMYLQKLINIKFGESAPICALQSLRKVGYLMTTSNIEDVNQFIINLKNETASLFNHLSNSNFYNLTQRYILLNCLSIFHPHKISNLYKATFVKSKHKLHSSRLFHMDIFHVCQTSKKSQGIFSTWQNVELMKHFSLSQKVDIVK